jgi:hypothetical protein
MASIADCNVVWSSIIGQPLLQLSTCCLLDPPPNRQFMEIPSNGERMENVRNIDCKPADYNPKEWSRVIRIHFNGDINY